MVQVLHTIGNPIRKSAIEALKKGGLRFSQLLAACDLDYDHDAGRFYYHLSELINKRIVEKIDEVYQLTEFGSKIAEVLDSIRRECSIIFLEGNIGDKGKVDIRSLETEWIDYGEEFRFEKKTEKEPMSVGFHTGASELQKIVTEKMPNCPERRKIIQFLEEVRSWKCPRTLLAKDRDMPLGWALVNSEIRWGDKPDMETGEPKPYAKTSLRIEDITIGPWTKVDRKRVALSILKDLIDKAREVKADDIQLMRVNAEDPALIEALRDLGFERVATNYSMKKTLQ